MQREAGKKLLNGGVTQSNLHFKKVTWAACWMRTDKGQGGNLKSHHPRLGDGGPRRSSGSPQRSTGTCFRLCGCVTEAIAPQIEPAAFVLRQVVYGSVALMDGKCHRPINSHLENL